MNFTFEETPESRQETADTYTLIYKAVGEQDDAIVQAYAINATPAMVHRPTGTMYRQDIRRDPDGWKQYRVTVNYGMLDATPFNVGGSSFTFDTTGGTSNVKQAREHIATYPPTVDGHGGSIGVRDDGAVEGVDIVIPALKLTYTYRHPQGVITEAYVRSLAAVTGMVNSLPFRGYEAGELLFVGASGSDGSQSEADVTYTFVASKNATGITRGAVTGINKGGHELVWEQTGSEVGADGKAKQKVFAVHVERVYDSFNFAAVFGWG